jgi:hypothetical protein
MCSSIIFGDLSKSRRRIKDKRNKIIEKPSLFKAHQYKEDNQQLSLKERSFVSFPCSYIMTCWTKGGYIAHMLFDHF